MASVKSLKDCAGQVLSIQYFSIHDGPGIRTTVFLKGCNLHCTWCHNPESLSINNELSLVDKNCTNCGECVSVCPTGAQYMEKGEHYLDRKDCILCGRCIDVCSSSALSILGRSRTAEDILSCVVRDRRYYDKSDGGMTVSGGEPTCQPFFLKALLVGAKSAELHTALETNGTADPEYYHEILPYTDLFLFDYKISDDTLHQKMTGCSRAVVLNNLETLCRSGADIILRCPIIPAVNDNPVHFRTIADLSCMYPGIRGYELMPYHALGMSKAHQTGNMIVKEYTPPVRGLKEEWSRKIKDYGGREWRN